MCIKYFKIDMDHESNYKRKHCKTYHNSLPKCSEQEFVVVQSSAPRESPTEMALSFQ